MATLQEVVAQAQASGQSVGSHNVSQVAQTQASPPVSQSVSNTGSNWLGQYIDQSGKADIGKFQSDYEKAKVNVEPPKSAPLSQTTLPMASSFQSGQDAARASDVELWSTIRKGAPGFSGSGVSGDTFQQAVEEMSRRQTQASLERQRTGAIDVSVDSSKGAMIEAGVVGPQQYLPESVEQSKVDLWREREREEFASVPSVMTPSGNVYYKPPDYKTVEEWQASFATLTPEQLEQADAPFSSTPTGTYVTQQKVDVVSEIGESPIATRTSLPEQLDAAMTVNVDGKNVDLRFSEGWDLPADENYVKTPSGETIPITDVTDYIKRNFPQMLGEEKVVVPGITPDLNPENEVIAPETVSFVRQTFGVGPLTGIMGVSIEKDNDVPWERAVAGIAPRKINQNTGIIPGISGYYYA